MNTSILRYWESCRDLNSGEKPVYAIVRDTGDTAGWWISKKKALQEQAKIAEITTVIKITRVDA